ncbi:hypothetical protein Q7P37_010048 [Cladosporium fusiforme]
MAGDLVLLTGATGFVGFGVLRAALQEGYRIRAAVRSEEKAETIRSNPTLQDITPEQLSFVIVPDFLAEGAFDEAVQGVKYILHVASPIPSPNISGENDDLDAILIQPAIQGTLGVYRSAQKAGSVQRIIVTSSAAAIVPLVAMTNPESPEASAVYSPDARAPAVPAPYMNNVQVAYNASKILALKHAEEFVATEKPGFDAIHIHPVIVLGRDELNLKAKDVSRGSNAFALNPVLGVDNPTPFPMTVTHIDDISLAHIRALDPKVEGNQSFLLSNSGEEGYTWDSTKTVAAKHFPEAIASGLLPNNGTFPGFAIKGDASKTEKLLGIKAKSFETMMVDLIGQYLELTEKEKQGL